MAISQQSGRIRNRQISGRETRPLRNGAQLHVIYFSHACHLERNEMESRDLRTLATLQLKSVRRSLESLCSLGMTGLGGSGGGFLGLGSGQFYGKFRWKLQYETVCFSTKDS